MAIYQATAVARRLKKSLGEQTFCRNRGRDVVKMKVEENTSNTPLQQRHRLAWKRKLELEELFDEASYIGFPKRPEFQTFHNAFMQANGEVVEVNESLEVTVDYTRILCAQGKLRVPKVMSVTCSADDRQLVFTHNAEKNGYKKREDDMLYAAVLEKELEELEVLELNRRSEDEAVIFQMPEDWVVEQLAVYVFVLSKDKHKASNSVYMEVKQA